MTGLSVAPVDLDNCAREPIHIPGSVQPHGVLLAVGETDLVVTIVSANIAEWFGRTPAESIGAHLQDVVGETNCAAVRAALRLDWSDRLDEVPMSIGDRALSATLFRSGGYLVIEIESDGLSGDRGSRLIREAAMSLQSCRTVIDVATFSARWIRSLTGFDRVMVYRFDPEWNGEVIAESKTDELNTFLGLHYPASDIPAQARELYRRNWLRIIPNIGYTPVPLVASPSADAAGPLDLSSSRLRSVSPIHIEYLSNMGVTASMSVSIVIDGALWGLIACHHYSGAHQPGLVERNTSEFLAQLISLRVSETVEADAKQRTFELSVLADQATEAFAVATHGTVDWILHEHQAEILGLADAVGAVVFAQGTTSRLGETPPDAVIRMILGLWPTGTEVFHTDHALGAIPAATADTHVVSGVLGVALTSDRGEYVMWFRPELIRSVDWGGDVRNAKIASREGPTLRLSPRKSFDIWREVISGRSDSWAASAVAAAERFARHLAGVLLRRERDSGALAKDLQQAMLPSSLPTVAGFEFSAYQQTSGRGSVGGDWYDAFVVDDHQIVAIIGDVAGHGLTAASEMTQLRNALRGYLVDRPDPGIALERLDNLMHQTMQGSIATVVCAVVDTRTSIMTISHAGHLPAFQFNEIGATVLPLQGDRLLGIN